MLVILLLSVLVAAADVLSPKASDESELLATCNECVRAVLEMVADPSCSLTLLTDGHTSTASLTQVGLGWERRQGLAIIETTTLSVNTNTTIQTSLSTIITHARSVRQRSWCSVVVVVSESQTFLARVAKWSLKGRLLVWSTKMLVVTRLALHHLLSLLPSHWTFSMMNTVVLNLENPRPNTRCVLYSYLPYSGGGAKMVKVAAWTSQQEALAITKGQSLFQEKYTNFHGAQVNVTALPFAPFWKEDHGGPDHNTTIYSGMDYLTIATIAKALNFSIYVIPTESWAEVARLVAERVAFLSTVYHNLMPQRMERYDFSFVYEYGSMDFSMAQPSLRPQWESLYYPLSPLVWALTLFTLIVAPLFLMMIIKVPGARGLKLGAVYQDMMGMLLGQNLPRRLPSTSSSRVLVTTWLVFALILGTSYRGNLTAFLTLPKYPPRPESLAELVATADRITMQPYGVEFRDFFAKSDSPVFQKLAELINFVPSVNTGQEQAVQKNQAHLENRRYQQLRIAERYTQADGRTLLYIGRDSIMPGQAAWPLPHDAPYTPVINRGLMAVIEGGPL